MNLQPLTRHDLQFCLRRCPKPVLQLLKDNPRRSCIAGGFIRAVIAGETVNDIDIFASSPEHARTMAGILSRWGMPNLEARRIFETDNALTVRGFRIDPQIVHRWTFEDIVEVISSFDFTIARAMIFWCDRLNMWQGFCDPRFYSDLAAKRLVYCSPERNEDAGGSMLRVLKFYQRGYRMPLDSLAAVMARMIQGVNKIDRGIMTEKAWSKRMLELLREVDPVVDADHIAHLPSEKE